MPDAVEATRAVTSVLLVEDEATVANIMVRWLESAGHAVRHAASAEEAIEQMAREPAGVVVCDVGLPGRDGAWLARELTARYPQSAVVLATGSAAVSPVVSLRRGVTAYLVKPFRKEQLRSAIDRALDWVTCEVQRRSAREALERGVSERREALAARIAQWPAQSVEDIRQVIERLYAADTLEHVECVRRLSVSLAGALRLSDGDTAALALASYLHELGKLVMPGSLLVKPETLTQSERGLLEQVPSETHALLRRHESLARAAEIILAMREKHAGLGYPQGLVADEIPLAARILGAVDAYDTMLRERPGRPARSAAEAAAEMRRTAGGQFDPEVVRVLLDLVETPGTA